MQGLGDLSTEDLKKLELSLRGFEEDPVDIETFILDPYFLGNYFKGTKFSPHWMDFLLKVYEKKIDSPAFLIFERGCLSGSTGITLSDSRSYSLIELAGFFKEKNQNLFIQSYDKDSDSFVSKRITNCFSTGIKTLYHITFSDSSFVDCTDNHKFLSVSGNWISLENGLLRRDSFLRRDRKDPISVISIKKKSEEYVFDLTVENTHNYVLQNGIISANSIGRGKSTTACVGALYDQYMMMCLKSPQEYFGLVPTESIVLFIMNVTVSMSEAVLMGKINDMINGSPYFSEQQKIAIASRTRGKKETKTRFPKGIDIRSGSRVSHTLGTAIHCLSGSTIIPIYRGVVFTPFFLSIEELFERFSRGIDTYVFSYSIETQERVVEKVLNVFDNGYQNVLNITLSNRQNIRCTRNHRLLLSNETYTEAGNLKVGDTLKSVSSSIPVSILSIEEFPKEHVFDLEIRNTHNFALEADIYSHNSAILSEAAFSIYNNQFIDAFNSILARKESRFLSDGKSSGRIWIDSSERDTGSILSELCDRYKGKEGVIIDSGPLWEIRPWNYGPLYDNKFCKFFYVYKGSDREPANIVDMEDIPLIERLCKDEINPILVVPEDHRTPFEANIDIAIRDLGGIATASKFRLFRNMKMLFNAFQGIPLYDDIIELDFYNPEDQIISHCKIPQYFDNIPFPNAMRFIHVDIGISGDKLGFAMSYISGRKDIEVQKDITNFTSDKTTDSMITTVTELAFSIKNKAGQQVPLNKVRIFIKWLKDRGIMIGGVSSDSFQSASMLQEMKLIGIDSSVISVDRSVDPYINLRNSVYEGRCVLPSNKLLLKELENLEITPDGSKIDHPDFFPGGKEPGSKDVSDAVCLSADTKVFLLSGSEERIEDLYFNQLRDIFVISYDEEHSVILPQRVNKIIRKGIPERLVRIHLQNGNYFDVTEDHLILTGDETYIAAKDLKPRDCIMSFNNWCKKFYESNYKGRTISEDYDISKMISSLSTSKKTRGETRVAGIEKFGTVTIPSSSLMIRNIEFIENDSYVYDIVLDTVHNFALSIGVFVHNCGSVFNCFKNQNKFNILEVMRSSRVDEMMFDSFPQAAGQDNSQYSYRSGNSLMGEILGRWSDIRDLKSEYDPYEDYLRTLDSIGSRDSSGDTLSDYMSRKSFLQ